MSNHLEKAAGFLKECGVFYFLTTDGDAPAGRPFGAIMAYEDHLYLSTQIHKSVYRQVKENPHVQIIALKSGTRDWIRISGLASECKDFAMKEKMLKTCPVLFKHFDSPEDERFVLLKVHVACTQLNLAAEVVDFEV